MADSGSLRTQRWKRHKAGDHSLCRRCAAMRSDADLREVAPAEQVVIDPHAELQRLAVTLAAAYQADPANAMLAREARMTLVALIEAMDAKPKDDELERLFADLDAAVPAAAGHT